MTENQQPKPQIILAGATGLIGKEVLNQLTFDVSEKVFALTRREISLSHDHHQLLVVTDLSSFDLPVAISDADAVICALGTTIKTAGSKQAFEAVDLDMVINFAKAAQSAGYKNMAIVSSLGANESSSNFYLNTKGRMEHALISMGFLSLTIIRPSLLLGDRGEFRLGEKLGGIFSFLLAPIFIGPLKKYQPIAAQRVARGLIQAIQNKVPGVVILESNKL